MTTCEFDLVLRGGTVVDGSGGPAYVADVGICGETIVAVAPDLGSAARSIDAQGMLVTPGFVDIHTHYDGQAIWDSRLTPSSGHGVTSVVMGNCGVGFAPSRPADRARLIELMEGVEDIPGVVMTEGLNWDWESYPEYLDRVEARPHDVNILSYLPHSPLRIHVMGERASVGEVATPEDIAEMARLTREAMDAGAIGFSTSRLLLHRSSAGEHIPTLDAAEAELQAIADVVAEAGGRILQINDDFDNYANLEDGFAMLRRIVEQARIPLTLPLVQNPKFPEGWETLVGKIEDASAAGLPIKAQAMPRGLGMILGLEASAHPFSLCPSYLAIAGLPLAERLERMRDPEFRQRLLGETPIDPNVPLYSFSRRFDNMYELGEPPNYEPRPEDAIARLAAEKGVAPEELAYDLLLARDGKALLYLPFTHYVGGNLDSALALLRHKDVVIGLGDGGAHYGLICDASYPTFVLSYLVRDRAGGEEFPLAEAVKILTREPALQVNLHDRGLVAPGYHADLNVIDFDKLTLFSPEVTADLPSGGRRLVQGGAGFVATIVNGVPTILDDVFTGELPGRLLRGPQMLAAE